MNTQLALVCAVFFVLGAVFATTVFMVVRETLIGRAVEAREREVYGPMLRHVQVLEAKARRNRESATRTVLRVSPSSVADANDDEAAQPTAAPAVPKLSAPRPSAPRPSALRPSAPRPSAPRPSAPRPSEGNGVQPSPGGIRLDHIFPLPPRRRP